MEKTISILDDNTISVKEVYNVTNEKDEVSEQEKVTNYTWDKIKANIANCNVIIEEYKLPNKFQAEHNTACVITEKEMWESLDKKLADNKVIVDAEKAKLESEKESEPK